MRQVHKEMRLDEPTGQMGSAHAHHRAWNPQKLLLGRPHMQSEEYSGTSSSQNTKPFPRIQQPPMNLPSIRYVKN